VDELAKDERVAAAYDLWNQMREEVCRTYTEHLPERVSLSRQKEFKSVRNMVIREVLQLGRDAPPQHSALQQSNLPSQAPGQTEQQREQSTPASSPHTDRATAPDAAPGGRMCAQSVSQYGAYLPGAVCGRCRPAGPAYRQETPPDAPGKDVWPWVTKPTTMRTFLG